jgi:hypothetical protein
MHKTIDDIANIYIDYSIFCLLMAWYGPTFAVGLLDVQEPPNGNPLHLSVCNP